MNKNKLFNGFIIGTFLVLLVEVILHKNLVFDTISYSLHVWVTSLIPSMFPFFIISDILIGYHIINYIPKNIKKTLMKLFRINESMLTIFLLSCLSGFPSSARNTRNLYDNELISKEEASHILMFTHFANPLFILSTVSIFFLQNETYGYVILLSHWIGNITLGIVTRFSRSICNTNYTPNLNKSQSFSTIFIKSIKSSIDTLLLIVGTLTCFLIFSSLVIKHIPVNDYNSALIKGILEITMGLKSLSLLNISDCYKVVISTMLISFGGLSVHLQVISQLVDTDISYQPFFIARIFHALISGGICFLLFFIFF